MREIARIQPAHCGQEGIQRRIRGEKGRPALLELIHEGPDRSGREIGAFAAGLGQHAHQGTKRHHAGPADRHIVTDIGQPARPQPLPDNVQQPCLVFGGDPAEHPVRDDEVERRQCVVGHRGDLGEGRLVEVDIGQAGAIGEHAPELDMGRVEVERVYLGMRGCRGGDQRREPVAAAEVGVAEGLRQIGGAMPEQEGRHGEPGRRGFPTDLGCVGHIGYIPIVPACHAR